jgi:hypothetical protein
LAILEKEVWIGLIGNNIEYWENKGYKIPRTKSKDYKLHVKIGTKILVKVDDLPKKSSIKVTKICDVCGETSKNQSYENINNYRNRTDGKDRCHKCGLAYAHNLQKHNAPYEKSLYYYAIRNDKKYLLDEYSNKNKYLPEQVYRSSNQEYLWTCLNCKSEYTMNISERTINECSCPYCAGKKVNKTNCLWTTHPEIAKHLKDQSLGYEITAGSNKEVLFICPDCKYEFNRIITNVNKRSCSCPKCSDGISYPAKFMHSILDQLVKKGELDVYKSEKKFSHPDWGDKRSDFYISSKNMIIETNGEQHKNGSFSNFRNGRTAKEEQENDKLKRKIAQEKFGIKHYIFLDCAKSEKEYIKNSVLKSEISNIFDLAKIDWDECAKFAMSSMMIKACKMWNSGKYKYPFEIANKLNISDCSVKRYLKRGSEAGIINYIKRRQIIQLSSSDNIIHIWKNQRCASNAINISPSSISVVCSGKYKTAGGFKWMYLSDYQKIHPEFTDEDVQKYLVK